MFTRLACNDPLALVPVVFMVVVGVVLHWIVPSLPVVLVRISPFSPVVSVSAALTSGGLVAVGVEPIILFIIRFIALVDRVSIVGMGPEKCLYVVAPPF